MTRETWAKQFLLAAGYPVRRHNILAIVAQASMETLPDPDGPKWNPLATTKYMPGSTNYNEIGVKNYSTFEQGLEATVETIKEHDHGYGPIRVRLQNNALPQRTMWAMEESDWGTTFLPSIEAMAHSVRYHFEDYGSKLVSEG